MSRTKSCFITFHPNPQAGLRLFCFPYAGGGAHVFREWARGLPASVEVYAAQYPGKGARLLEEPFTDVAQFVEESFSSLLLYSDKPFVFFGHSMGALLSFELARRLRREKRPLPLHLFVSGRGTLRGLRGELRRALLSDSELVEELRRFDGAPAELFGNAELMQMMLPSIRADFTACESYVYTAEPPLTCSISAFGGLRDQDVSREQLEAWRDETTDAFSCKIFPGGHFFLETDQSWLLQAMAQELSSLSESPGLRTERSTGSRP
jgi:medium-chain acyl-[acyl-carrier-protein] hydrolase